MGSQARPAPTVDKHAHLHECTRSTTAFTYCKVTTRRRNRLRHQRHLCRGQLGSSSSRTPAKSCSTRPVSRAIRRVTKPSLRRPSRWVARAEQQCLRHLGQPDCGLLRRHARFAHSEQQRHQYLLSNNHVLARSDQAPRVKPSCSPALLTTTARPTGKPAQHHTSRHVTAFFLEVGHHQRRRCHCGRQLGSRQQERQHSRTRTLQANGTLAAAPPGTSSTAGKGEAAALNMTVPRAAGLRG